jgi:DNA gyrase C-terminal domain, beta-propeller
VIHLHSEGTPAAFVWLKTFPALLNVAVLCFCWKRALRLSPQVLPIRKTDSIAAMLPVSKFTDDDFLVMLTENGLIKRTPLSDFETIRSNGLIAIKLRVR